MEMNKWGETAREVVAYYGPPFLYMGFVAAAVYGNKDKHELPGKQRPDSQPPIASGLEVERDQTHVSLKGVLENRPPESSGEAAIFRVELQEKLSENGFRMDAIGFPSGEFVILGETEAQEVNGETCFEVGVFHLDTEGIGSTRSFYGEDPKLVSQEILEWVENMKSAR